MSVATLTREAECACDGSGWLVRLDRGRYTPGEADAFDVERCSCLERAVGTTVALVYPSEAPTGPLAYALGRERLYVEGVFDSVSSLLATGVLPDVVAASWESSTRRDRARLRLELPRARLVVVTGDDAPRALRDLLDEELDGIVLESEAPRTLVHAVLAVACGQIVMPRAARERTRRPALSAREKQALGMVVMGFTNGEIAARLHLTESTIKSHLSSAFAKLGVRSRNEAAALILDADSGLGAGILSLAS
jgi:DNA-binding CsgD family transcriptional regulator